ncbi:SPOSA6832_00218 [Sporobolomyces salmonicolor]|uniref:SPOSA6832_00218-mRNA-1:cds n=1 Tax=Sporidiobolus salmonicolor TaxID=5005 RepID=A0A0D6EG68_SPOSA|nr:SPOSA6832_00218 [Sporobolomyces salmonicolor]
MPSPPPSRQPSRAPALVIALSSLLLSAGLAVSLYVYTASLQQELVGDAEAAGDMDQATVIAWWAGDAALKWALLSAAGSLCGVVGILMHNSALHRVFAVSTFADLLLTLLLTLTLALLTFTPTLSQPFGSFLCSSVGSGLSSPSAQSLLGTAHDSESLSWSSGIEILLWGVETCEESWHAGLVRVIAGCVVAASLRIYGVWVSWEMNAELKDQELRDQGEGSWMVDPEYVDEGARGTEGKSPTRMEETLVRRSRASSTSTAVAGPSSRRSHTLPATGLPPPYAYAESQRVRSHTISYPPHPSSSSSLHNSAPTSASSGSRQRPRLVLLPVYVNNHGNPVYSPSSPSFPYALGHPAPAPPAYAARTPSPRTRSSTSPGMPFSSRPHVFNRNPSSKCRNRSSSSSSSSSSASRSSSSSPVASSAVSAGSKTPLPSPPIYTSEPMELTPPTTPTATTSSTSKAANSASRRPRSRSETAGAVVPGGTPEQGQHPWQPLALPRE